MTQESPHQPRLHYEDLDDALQNAVLALGGFKKVGPKLWPALPMEDAAQRLRHSLNKSRREKLSQHETLLLLRLAREAGFHAAKYFLDDTAGYSRSAPLDPKDERLRAIAALEAATAEVRRASEALQRASSAA